MNYTPTVGKLIALRSGMYRIAAVIKQGSNYVLAVTKPEGTRKWMVTIDDEAYQLSGLSKF